MEGLRERLRQISAGLSSSLGANGGDGEQSSEPESRLVQLSARVLLALGADSSLHLLRTSEETPSSARARVVKLSAELPPDAHSLVVSRSGFGSAGKVAVVAPSSIWVVDVDTETTRGRSFPVAKSLFESRPGLRVLQVSWHPRAESYLVVLTSDGSIRLFDAAGPGAAESERSRLRVVTTGDGPVAFGFGHATGWDAVALYVMSECGRIYVASPVAPVGTRISRSVWTQMKEEAEQVLVNAGVPVPEFSMSTVKSPIGSPNPSVSHISRSPAGDETPRRQIDFGRYGAENRSSAVVTSSTRQSADHESTSYRPSDDADADWAVRQAKLQIRFLSKTFKKSRAGDMVVVRDFKPAPVLFQGPLYVERDDMASGDRNADDEDYCSLTVVDGGPRAPLVLLRATDRGHVSVLIGMESVEAQWLLNHDSLRSPSNQLQIASEEYAKAASIVAPALLCLEHLEFPARAPVALSVLRGKSDFDVLLARSGGAVFSVRLAFLSALDDAESLKSAPASVIAPLLTTDSVDGDGPQPMLRGLAPLFERNGPLAVSLTSDYRLESTAVLRWVSNERDCALPESLVDSEAFRSRNLLDTKTINDTALDSASAKKSKGFRTDATIALKGLDASLDVQSWTVGDGSVGMVKDAKSVPEIVQCLETRLKALTGGVDGTLGAGDQMKTLAITLTAWTASLEERLTDLRQSSDIVVSEKLSRSLALAGLASKIRRAKDLNVNLRARVDAAGAVLTAKQAILTEAERERFQKLRQRKRAVAFLRTRVEELAAAVRAKREADETAKMRASFQRGGASDGENAIGSISQSPLSTRRSPSMRASPGRDAALNPAALQRVKQSLMAHAAEIQAATERTTALWAQFEKL